MRMKKSNASSAQPRKLANKVCAASAEVIARTGSRVGAAASMASNDYLKRRSGERRIVVILTEATNASEIRHLTMGARRPEELAAGLRTASRQRSRFWFLKSRSGP